MLNGAGAVGSSRAYRSPPPRRRRSAEVERDRRRSYRPARRRSISSSRVVLPVVPCPAPSVPPYRLPAWLFIPALCSCAVLQLQMSPRFSLRGGRRASRAAEILSKDGEERREERGGGREVESGLSRFISTSKTKRLSRVGTKAESETGRGSSECVGWREIGRGGKVKGG